MEESTKEQFEQLHAKVDFLRAALTHEADRAGTDDRAFMLIALVNQIAVDCRLLAVASGRVAPWMPILDLIGTVFACEDTRPHYHSDGLRGPYRTCVEPSQGCYPGNGFTWFTTRPRASAFGGDRGDQIHMRIGRDGVARRMVRIDLRSVRPPDRPGSRQR